MNKQDYKKAIKNHGTTVLVIIAALVFSVSVVAIKKSYDNFTEYREINQHETQVLETLETNRENLEHLQTRAQELEEEGVPREAVVSLVPLQYYPVADFATLEQLTDISSISMENIRVSESTEVAAVTDRLTPYQVTITVAGSYNELKDFYTNIEESAQPMIVNEIDINSEAGGVGTDGGGSITSQVKIILHHQGGNETAGDEFESSVPGEGAPGGGIPGEEGEVLE